MPYFRFEFHDHCWHCQTCLSHLITFPLLGCWLRVGNMRLSCGPVTPDWPPTGHSSLMKEDEGNCCRSESVGNSPLSFSFVCRPLCMSVSLSLFLCHCVSDSLHGDAGRARSVWIRAVSRRSVESIYSLVCSGPHWTKVSVCFSFCLLVSFCQSAIHLSHIS